MSNADWRPAAGREVLAERAALLARLRAFFAERQVLEVETPLLCSGTVTDPHLVPIRCDERWLQTSPEYAMKRLLAAGSGDIFQISKAFRAGETGTRHNPEFTMLEWYRTGFTLEQLMLEVVELVCEVLERSHWSSVRYGELFGRRLGIDPHRASMEALEECARSHVNFSGSVDDRDGWLDLLMSHVIEPGMAEEGVVLVSHYPRSQAALARLKQQGDILVAERFELFVDGVELANGYLELSDPQEQAARFDAENAALSEKGGDTRPRDERLLAALEEGLPDCAGVALGVDRLLMLKLGAKRLEDVLSFDWHRC